MKKLAAIALVILGLGGCARGACTDATIFGDCRKYCVKHQDNPSECSCSKSCSCWPSHPGGSNDK